MNYSYDQVNSLFIEVEPFFKRAGIKSCKMPTGDINLIPAEKFIKAYDFLDDVLKSPEWEEVQKVWGLLSPDMWAAYDFYEISGLHEQRLLTAALEDLKILWRDKPSAFFGKHYEEADRNRHS